MRNFLPTSPALAPRQAVCMPTPTAISSGSMGMRNAVSKYGGPTEILPASSASSTSGYTVPRKTSPAAMHSRMLLTRRKLSRENGLKPTGPVQGRCAPRVEPKGCANDDGKKGQDEQSAGRIGGK